MRCRITITMRGIPQVAALAVAAATTSVGAASGSTVAPLSLKGGQRVVFRAGVLGVGRGVVCTSHGIRVVARVPHRGKGVVTIGDGMKGSATLRLTTRSDGSVVASCQ
jgi:hypothetical protein